MKKGILFYLTVANAFLLLQILFVNSTAYYYNQGFSGKTFLAFFIFQYILYVFGLSFHSKFYENKKITSIISIPIYWCFAIIPAIIISSKLGNIDINLLFLPILIQIFSGISIFYASNSKGKILNMLYLFINIILIPAILYLDISYNKYVITTVFDNDLNLLYGVNNFFAMGGYLYGLVGGENYLGIKPFIINSIFNLATVALLYFSSKNFRKTEEVKINDIN